MLNVPDQDVSTRLREDQEQCAIFPGESKVGSSNPIPLQGHSQENRVGPNRTAHQELSKRTYGEKHPICSE